MNSDLIRQELIKGLQGLQAHMPVTKIIEGFPADKINTHIDEVPYTPWELVEHMCLTQHDILEYIVNPDYKEPSWPDDYWPPRDRTASVDDWNTSVKQFSEDIKSLEEIINNPETDLTAPLVHNPKHTIFREMLIIGNHNSYHSGQLLILKRVLKIY